MVASTVLADFAAWAARQPDAVVAVFHDRRVTYAELDERSTRLARWLATRGVGPGVPVAVCLRPGPDVLSAILGIFKAGGVYFPLDPKHPEAFVARMLEEARPPVVLTHSGVTAVAPSDGVARLCLDTDASLLDGQAPTPPTPPSLDDAACLFYTSGTTGRPKGVLATHENVAHYLRVARGTYGFAAADRFCSLARYTFSISLFELLSPLGCGGSLRLLDREEVLSPDRLHRALEDVTVVHAGPSLLGSLFRYLRANPSVPGTLPGVRHASSGGDMVLPNVMEEMKRVFENAELFVIYGCTEIACMGTTFPIDRGSKVAHAFVGKPFDDVTVRVLDDGGGPTAVGQVGEIVFAGKGIARGYLDRPELTAERFVTLDGARAYRTGDLGRVHADGHLEILGRRDFQVQLRGIRIEPAGIEQTIHELDLAAQCAVVARTMAEGDVRLVAFVVEPRVPTAAAFRAALGVQLPEDMLPQHVVVLDALPLTANGKVDRNGLKDVPLQPQLGAERQVAPAGAVERAIAEAFAHVLGVDRVGVEDSFFDLGGDSLLAVLALEEVARRLGTNPAPEVLFASGSVRALAAHLQSGSSRSAHPILLTARSDGPALFMLSGVHVYRELAARLDGHCAAYGVFAEREIATPDPDAASAGGAGVEAGPDGGMRSVEELAREYVAIVRRAQPAGPYRLLGYSFAGIVAYEVAQQLRAAGQEVRVLALVDAVLPEWEAGWRFRVAQLRRLRSAGVVAFASRRLGEKLGVLGPELGRYAGDPRRAALDGRRDAVNRLAAAAYMPRIRPFPGHVTVIASGERLRRDPLKSTSCGWDDHTPDLSIRVVGGDHFAMMTDEPYVSQLAGELLGEMRRADGRG